MNGVIYKAYFAVLCPMQTSLRFDYRTLRWTGGQKKLTQADIDKFVNVIAPSAKQQWIEKIIKPGLLRSGFIYDKNLFKNWKFEIRKGDGCIQYTCYIYFEDTNNEGKTAFMKAINNTGLFKYDLLYLYKPYGKIY